MILYTNNYSLLALAVLISAACQQSTTEPSSNSALTISTNQSTTDLVNDFESFPQESGRERLNSWYVIKLQGKPAGWCHLTLFEYETAVGLRRVITNRQQLTLRRGKDQTQLFSTDIELENRQGSLLRFQHIEKQAGGDETRTIAGKLGSEMVTIRGPEIHRVPYERRSYGPSLPFRHLSFEKNGTLVPQIKFRSYLARTAGYVENLITQIKKIDGEEPIIEFSHHLPNIPGLSAKVRTDQWGHLFESTHLIGTW